MRKSPWWYAGGSAVMGILYIFTAFPAHASNVTLSLSPVNLSIARGDTLTVQIVLDTDGAAVNAVQADLLFPADKLQVVTPSSGRSFIQIWVDQPAYSNQNGTVHFAGAVPNPGIVTPNGLVSAVTFRATATGRAAIRFAPTSKVYLNDGKGTNVLTGASEGVYTIGLPPPGGPIVTSPTHPDENRWYNAAQAVFEWKPEGFDTFSYVLDDRPFTVPDDAPEGAATSVRYPHVTDGIHYFHLKGSAGGIWGATTNYTIRVDTLPPAQFKLDILPSVNTVTQNPVFEFRTTDALSGIDHYELKIGQDPFFEVASPYVSKLAIGKYQVVLRAFDRAGNFTDAASDLEIIDPFTKLAGNDITSGTSAGVSPWWYVGGSFIVLLLLLIYQIYLLRTIEKEKRLTAQIGLEQIVAERLKEKE